MSKSEFYRWFVEQVKPRWPRWVVGPCDLADWFSAFGGCDEDVLTRAVAEHRIYDDPARPSTKKLVAIIKKLSARRPRKPREPAGPPAECLTVGQFWEKVRTTFTREQRIKNIVSFAKWYPRAKERDPQAYDWAVQEGLIHDSRAESKGKDSPQAAAERLERIEKQKQSLRSAS